MSSLLHELRVLTARQERAEARYTELLRRTAHWRRAEGCSDDDDDGRAARCSDGSGGDADGGDDEGVRWRRGGGDDPATTAAASAHEVRRAGRARLRNLAEALLIWYLATRQRAPAQQRSGGSPRKSLSPRKNVKLPPPPLQQPPPIPQQRTASRGSRRAL